MANQLAMHKSFAISNLHSAGYSERRIAQTLGVSRGAARRHLRRSNANGTKAPTGSGGQSAGPETLDAAASSGSQCEPFREIILAKYELGLSAKRIHQDLVADHEFDGKYWSVN
jgi:IS30 family transposase